MINPAIKPKLQQFEISKIHFPFVVCYSRFDPSVKIFPLLSVTGCVTSFSSNLRKMLVAQLLMAVILQETCVHF